MCHVFPLLSTAFSLVPAIIFCAMELFICHFPMGHPRLWFLMVGTKLNVLFYCSETLIICLSFGFKI